MTQEKRDFNKDAAAWDENPGRVKMAESAFDAIDGNMKLSKEMDILDFGCGTGLLSLKLLPYVHSVTGADSSTGMLEVLNSKITAQNLSGIKTLYIDIDKGTAIPGTYDAVTSSMTMHHIKEPAALIKQFYNVIKPGGFLCIADLDTDNGKFHDNSDGVFHEGFQRDEMKKFYKDAGFTGITDVTAAEISKPDKDGNMNSFTIFLIVGKKG
ncbi:MAG TPA: class I SAM-dependent methyltransferase [Spirochaetota bacterium]|nr:class I SAM-dependent methyltransferase [Spirochaetota bacterium]HPS88149.1 class I SAM-dependent methyltransferase [Spirochaetota bacterium]